MTSILTRSPEETVAIGRAFSASLRPGDVVALYGSLGSGKTQFVGGVCDGLGVRVHATSPTFTLINEYPAPFGEVAHIDLYRIGTREELAELGIEDYFSERYICLIEWPELMEKILPRRHFEVRLLHGPENSDRQLSYGEVTKAAP